MRLYCTTLINDGKNTCKDVVKIIFNTTGSFLVAQTSYQVHEREMLRLPSSSKTVVTYMGYF